MKSRSEHNLPTKQCVVCNLPFEWRKKWEKVWDQVKYCSERCRRVGDKNQAVVSNAPKDRC